MPDVDLRGADLSGSQWGSFPRHTVLANAKIAGANITSMTGEVSDPVDVGSARLVILEGAELQQWFRDHGAPSVIVNTRS